MTRARGVPPLRVVAFGGGHGLAASLQALRRLTPAVTAVVTVADDGGSSGRLRRELAALPPGDLRMALTALAEPAPARRGGRSADRGAWRALFDYRFPGSGELGGHSMGNLVLTALADLAGGPVAALQIAGRLLGVSAQVLPMCTEPLEILAEVAGVDPAEPLRVRTVRGQAAVATTRGRVLSVRLDPPAPETCPEVLAAIDDATWLVLGPGSLFTSLVPHLLVPKLGAAIAAAPARRICILNLAPQSGETDGFTPQAHLAVLGEVAPQLSFDVILADVARTPDPQRLRRAAKARGAHLVLAPLAAGRSDQHDPALLARALDPILGCGEVAPWR